MRRPPRWGCPAMQPEAAPISVRRWHQWHALRTFLRPPPAHARLPRSHSVGPTGPVVSLPFESSPEAVGQRSWLTAKEFRKLYPSPLRHLQSGAFQLLFGYLLHRRDGVDAWGKAAVPAHRPGSRGSGDWETACAQ